MFEKFRSMGSLPPPKWEDLLLHACLLTDSFCLSLSPAFLPISSDTIAMAAALTLLHDLTLVWVPLQHPLLVMGQLYHRLRRPNLTGLWINQCFDNISFIDRLKEISVSCSEWVLEISSSQIFSNFGKKMDKSWTCSFSTHSQVFLWLGVKGWLYYCPTSASST